MFVGTIYICTRARRPRDTVGCIASRRTPHASPSIIPHEPWILSSTNSKVPRRPPDAQRSKGPALKDLGGCIGHFVELSADKGFIDRRRWVVDKRGGGRGWNEEGTAIGTYLLQGMKLEEDDESGREKIVRVATRSGKPGNDGEFFEFF